MYHARPNNAGDFRQWWGKGGSELWDRFDPDCVTEKGEHVFNDGRIVTGDDHKWAGPFSWREAGVFDAHARGIKGYYIPGTGYAVVWRQGPPIEEGEQVEP
jgi:hypothetical protein